MPVSLGGSCGHDVPPVALDDPLEARVLVAGNEQVAPVEIDERVELVRGERDQLGAVVPAAFARARRRSRSRRAQGWGMVSCALVLLAGGR